MEDQMAPCLEGAETMAVSEFAPRLLAWYTKNGRDLPWRVKGGPHPDPYMVWISEIMLQQTTVATVIPYFKRFVDRFPDLSALMAASLDDILTVWQGLGYYRRAHQLYACAKVVWEKYGGIFPKPERPEDLRKLPGIGPYTASSIAALAFDMPAAVVDGNVARILSRLYCIDVPLDSVRNRLVAWAEALLPKANAADYTSAIMDLGAIVCRPRNPECPSCPWREGCCATRRGESDHYPVKQRREKPSYSGLVYWLEDDQGRVLVRRQRKGRLLSGLSEFPWSVITHTELIADRELITNTELINLLGPWEDTGYSVYHVFTHFKLKLRIIRRDIISGDFAKARGDCEGGGILGDDLVFVPQDEFQQYPFSRLMRKVIDIMARGE